jgi:imidazolonepropionase-like amidohydrolase
MLGARALDLEHETGTVQPGKCPDLLVLSGNPLEDIAILQKRDAIVQIFRGPP